MSSVFGESSMLGFFARYFFAKLSSLRRRLLERQFVNGFAGIVNQQIENDELRRRLLSQLGDATGRRMNSLQQIVKRQSVLQPGITSSPSRTNFVAFSFRERATISGK